MARKRIDTGYDDYALTDTWKTIRKENDPLLESWSRKIREGVAVKSK